MRVDVRDELGVTVIAPHGKVTIGGGDVILRDAISAALESGRTRLVVDLRGITGMDSSGLGELVGCRAVAERQGAEVKLLDGGQKLSSLLTMTRLVGVFQIVDDLDAAVAAFERGRWSTGSGPVRTLGSNPPR